MSENQADPTIQDDPNYEPPEPTYDINEIPDARLAPVDVPEAEEE